MHNRKRVLLITAGLSALTLGWAIFKASRSSAANRQQTRRPESIVLIGDSQTARHLGDAFTQVFDDYSVNYFGKPGATHDDYLKDRDLQDRLAELPCADVIYVQLGDNGVSANTNTVLQFVETLKSKCPSADIYWGGPMKAVAPTIKSNYVTTDDRSSPRYLPTFNDTRRIWTDRLRNTLESTDVTFISNYDLQEDQPSSYPFSDSRKGDGIHLTKESALSLAGLIRDIIETQ
jgi:hypothetical protein